jgi:hypothetical protein
MKIKMAAELAASHIIDFIGFLAPQVGLEQSRLIQPLARIHIDFATNAGKSKGYATSHLAPTTSSEIAKIARIGISAVQKQYIFGSSLTIRRGPPRDSLPQSSSTIPPGPLTATLRLSSTATPAVWK